MDGAEGRWRKQRIVRRSSGKRNRAGGGWIRRRQARENEKIEGVESRQAKVSEKVEAGFKGRPTKGIERMESKGRQAREEQEDGR